MSDVDKEGKLTINKETVEILVANVIPTTKYFESRFDHMQYQINDKTRASKDQSEDYSSRRGDGEEV